MALVKWEFECAFTYEKFCTGKQYSAHAHIFISLPWISLRYISGIWTVFCRVPPLILSLIFLIKIIFHCQSINNLFSLQYNSILPYILQSRLYKNITRKIKKGKCSMSYTRDIKKKSWQILWFCTQKFSENELVQYGTTFKCLCSITECGWRWGCQGTSSSWDSHLSIHARHVSLLGLWEKAGGWEMNRSSTSIPCCSLSGLCEGELLNAFHGFSLSEYGTIRTPRSHSPVVAALCSFP